VLLGSDQRGPVVGAVHPLAHHATLPVATVGRVKPPADPVAPGLGQKGLGRPRVVVAEGLLGEQQRSCEQRVPLVELAGEQARLPEPAQGLGNARVVRAAGLPEDIEGTAVERLRLGAPEAGQQGKGDVVQAGADVHVVRPEVPLPQAEGQAVTIFGLPVGAHEQMGAPQRVQGRGQREVVPALADGLLGPHAGAGIIAAGDRRPSPVEGRLTTEAEPQRDRGQDKHGAHDQPLGRRRASPQDVVHELEHSLHGPFARDPTDPVARRTGPIGAGRHGREQAVDVPPVAAPDREGGTG
jgi:hypothetical protein